MGSGEGKGPLFLKGPFPLPSLPSLHTSLSLRRLAAGVRFVERLPRLAHGLVSLRLNGGNHLINIPIVGDLKLGCVVFLGDILRGMGMSAHGGGNARRNLGDAKPDEPIAQERALARGQRDPGFYLCGEKPG